ncbi:MAG: hypothetical protein HQL82_03600 [Magnetococcales bacterium]|nr:hypothetical protein [Magnetococcales bacterium]
MPHVLTLDDIWELFHETNRLFQESKQKWDQQFQESNQQFQESKQKWDQQWDQSQREWDRRRLETERDIEETRRTLRESRAETERQLRESRAETERQLRESRAETERQLRESRAKAERDIEETRRMLRESNAKADREIAESWRVLRETKQVVKDVSRQIGQLGSRWGEFVEGLVAPACATLFAERGVPVHKVSRRVEARLPGNRHMEIDLLVVNTIAVVLVEVKSKLRGDDIKEHLARLAEFKDFFPEYADKRILGAVAGIVVEENVDRYAMNEGLFVIVQSGDGVRLANEADFVPRSW